MTDKIHYSAYSLLLIHALHFIKRNSYLSLRNKQKEYKQRMSERERERLCE